MRLKHYWLALYLIFSFSVFGQYLPSKNYTTADGLPNNAVRSLFIDNTNALWIGTENGVSKMVNGSFFNLDESDGLGHNSCWDIAQDANGNMWFASYGGGVTKFDGNKFIVFTTKNGLLANKTRKIFPYKNKVYVGTEQGVSIIDIDTNQIVSPKVPQHRDDFICISIVEYNGEIYFTSIFDGLYKIDESGIEPRIVPIMKYKNSYCISLFDNILYSSNKGYINKFDINSVLTGNSSSKKIGQSIVWQYAKSSNAELYAAAWGIFNPDGGLYKIVEDKMTDVSKLFGIDSKIILNVVYDESKDILYVGSNDKGIYQVRLNKMIDYHLFDSKAIIDFDVLENQKIILHNKGLSFIDSNNKVNKILTLADFKRFEVSAVKNSKNLENKQGIESRDFELNFNNAAKDIIFYELVKHNNTFWIASNIGIFQISAQGIILGYIPKHSLKIGFTSDNKFIETITYAGVRTYKDIYSLEAKSFSKFDESTPQYIVKILTNREKTYLLSVFNGLYVHHNNQFHSYLAEGIWKEKKFKHIAINNKGHLILSAEFGDVFIVDDKTSFKLLKTISKKSIIGTTISFLEAYGNYILIGTEKRLNIYKDGVMRFVDKQLGLKDCVITTSQIFDDSLWLGTKEGFYTIDLDLLLKEQRTVSHVSITNLSVNNIPVHKSNFKWFKYASNKLDTDYNHNSLSIDFTPEGHLVSDKLKFRYRLKKTNRWSPYSDKTNLFLPYLPYGNYDLQIEVLDINAGKLTLFDVLKIHISPPFWFSWWFISMMVLIIIGFICLLVLHKKRKLKEKAKIENQITEAKFEALSNQMNPHFIYNALKSIQNFVGANNDSHSTFFISEFSGLMRKTLKNSPQQTISIKDEVEYLKSYIYIENMRFKNRVVCEVIVSPLVKVTEFKIPPMLIQPFVENVFAHAFDDFSKDPKLTISFMMINEELLECKVIDNGKGLNAVKQSKFHVSRGIALARERIILLQKHNENPIVIEHTEDHGTVVTIHLFV
ncbi:MULTISPECIES: sensor histidine kinase [unclassified Flavobacterium]|uniref:sensor histidine kinase n=1 Tax=unclassified Flavobacterium TaxID=196869 RepID=UPI003F8FAC81